MSDKTLNCAPNPCNSCPYRKDTPPNEQPTKVPLYASGEEARRAGIFGIKKPGVKAREKIQQILRRRNKSK